MNRIATASILATAFIAAGAQPVAAQGQEAHEFNAPLTFVVQNPCSAEAVAIEGNADLLFQNTTNDSQVFTKIHTAITGKGLTVVDPTEPTTEPEIRYTFGDEFNDELHLMGDDVVATSTRTIHLTSAGRTDNFALKFLVHINITEGIPSPAITKLSCECRGSSDPAPEEVDDCIISPSPLPIQ